MHNCSDMWEYANSELWTDPLRPKGLSADTSAAYGLLAFRGDNPRLKLVLTGKFPNAKFMSLQVYRSRLQTSHQIGDPLLDYEIDPIVPGTNPFRQGDPNLSGDFKIEITPDIDASGNSIYYKPLRAPGRRIISAFYRIYQPRDPLGFADLPTIEARDVVTNDLISCPSFRRLDWYLDLPNILERIAATAVGDKNQITFRLAPPASGVNAAIPGYIFSVSEVDHGRVVVISFKAPEINYEAPNQGDVRYWSICSMVWRKLKCLNGLPCDWSRPNRREVNLVFGPDERDVKNKAKSLCYDFLPDTRDDDDPHLGFAYRNVLPNSDFQSADMYQNEFRPRATVYTTSEFMKL